VGAKNGSIRAHQLGGEGKERKRDQRKKPENVTDRKKPPQRERIFLPLRRKSNWGRKPIVRSSPVLGKKSDRKRSTP